MITDDGVGVQCVPAKGDKGKTLLTSLQAELVAGDAVDFKSLEKMRGFFIHLQRTYPVLTPYLKGMHLTLDGWSSNQDEELWALP
jgi:hypothetical protein